MKNFILTFAIIAASAMGAFAYGERLSNIQWTLTYANGRAVSESRAYLEISTDQNRFSGNAGCNRMFGTVELKDPRIAFSAIGTTKMMCKLPAGNVSETAFLNALDKARRFARDGNTLHMYDRSGRTVLRFKRSVKQSPVESVSGLQSRKWVLESIKDRKTFAALHGAFVNFDSKKGSAGGNSGCNVFGGDYLATKTTLKISDIISTMRACVEGGKMSVEGEFLNGLREADRFYIKDDRLFLYKGRKLQLTFRGEPKS
jgi:heat shock protein HslJ